MRKNGRPLWGGRCLGILPPMKASTWFKSAGILLIVLAGAWLLIADFMDRAADDYARALVEKHATAWETGDEELLSSILAEDAVFAYPGRRLSKAETLADLRAFSAAYRDTKVYVNEVIVDGNNIAVEWQFATTKNETGKREVVSDAIIAEIKDGKFVVWKEYLDGRVKGLQAEGKLELEEGAEPFPWPKKIEIRAE